MGLAVVAIFAGLAGGLCLCNHESDTGLRSAWKWLGIGCFTWATGATLSLLIDLRFSQNIAWALLAGYAGLVGCCLLALISIGRRRSLTQAMLLDGLMIGVVSVTGVVELVVKPLIRVEIDSFDPILTFIGQICGAGLIPLSAVGLVWFSRRQDRLPIAAILTVFAAPAFVFALHARLSHQLPETTSSSYLLTWAAAFAAVALAARLNGRGAVVLNEPLGDPGARSLRRLASVSALSVTAEAGLAIRAALDPGINWVIIVSIGALWALIVYRFNGSARLTDRLAERTRERDRLHAVVDLSTAIVAAENVDSLLRHIGIATAKALDRTHADVVLRSWGGVAVRVDRGELEAALTFEAKKHPFFELRIADADSARNPFTLTVDDPLLPDDLRRSWLAAGKLEVLVAPMVTELEVLGHVEVWAPNHRRGFSPDDVFTASAVVQEGSLAIQNTRLLDQTRRTVNEREVLLKVTRAATSSLDLYAVLAEIAESTLGVAGIECTAVELWHPQTDELEIAAQKTIPEWPGVDEPGTRYAVGYWVRERELLANRSPIRFDVLDPELDEASRTRMVDAGTGSMLVFPLWVGEQCLGILDVFSRQVDAFDEETQRLGSEIAAQTALAIRNAQLLQSEHNRAMEWSILHQVSRAATSSLDVRQVLAEIASASMTIPGAECCTIALWDEAEREFEVLADIAVDGWDCEDDVGTRYSDSEWSFDLEMLRNRTPVVVERDDPQLNEFNRQKLQEFGIESLAVVPIIRHDKEVGIFYLSSRRLRALGQDALRLGREIASQTALAIHNARLLEAERERGNDWAILHRVSRAAVSSLDKQIVLNEVARACLNIPGTDCCTIFSLDMALQEMIVEADIAVPDWPGLVEPGTRFPLVPGAAEFRAISGRTPVIVEADDPDLIQADRDVMAEYGMASIVIVPVWLSNEDTGVIYFASREPGAFDDKALNLGTEIGTQVALALNNARLLEVERRRSEERSVLLRVSQAATSSLDLSTVLTDIAQASRDVAGVDTCDIKLWQPGAEPTHVNHGIRPLDSEPVPGLSPLTRGLSTRGGVVFHFDDDHIPDRCRREMEQVQARAMAQFPLWIGNNAVGTLLFYSTSGDSFSESTLRIGGEIALQTALAIQNAQLLEESRRYAEEQSALLRVSRAVATSIDLRDVMNEVALASLAIAGAECCEIELFDPAEDETEVVAVHSLPTWTNGMTELGKRFRLCDWPLTRQVIESRTAVIVDPESKALTEIERVFLLGERQQSTLFIPMVVGERCLGVVGCYAAAQNAFSSESIRLGADLASQGAIAIERIRMHSALKEQANTDGLTGVLNHRAIQERLDVELNRAQRLDQTVAVMMVDLNRFKHVNDTHGHQIGDRVLQRVAQLLKSNVREYDEVGRYGGDEFMLILPDAGTVEAIDVGDRILSAATRLNVVETDSDMAIGLAIGVAVYPIQATTRQELIDLADHGMYESKRQWHGPADDEPPAVSAMGDLSRLPIVIAKRTTATIALGG